MCFSSCAWPRLGRLRVLALEDLFLILGFLVEMVYWTTPTASTAQCFRTANLLI